MTVLRAFGESRLVLLLCVLAALRTFAYSAAFPPFDNMDESLHYDMVLKYSHDGIPRKFMPISPEVSSDVAAYGSPEYFWLGKTPPRHRIFSKKEIDGMKADMAAKSLRFGVNHETAQSPLYYVLAALWLRLGRIFGVAGGLTLYWIRFLNAPLAALMTWLGFKAARLVFPEEKFLRLGVPALLAALPQDAFYSVESDVLSPVISGAAFIAVVRWLRAGFPSKKESLVAGLFLGSTILAKLSNVPLAATDGAATLTRAWCRIRAEKNVRAANSFLLLALGAALPLTCWAAWSLGYITDTGPKILLWQLKSPDAWLSHPLFTARGFGYFWSRLLASLWRGEQVWAAEPLGSPEADGFYWISTSVLLGAAAVGLVPRLALPSSSVAQRRALWLAMASFLSVVAFNAAMSLAFDFGSCPYPSRELPYFVSGRLLSGALVPFSLIYLYGLSWLLRSLWDREWPLWAALATIIAVMTCSLASVDGVVFASPWNWYHMISAPS